MLPINIMRTRSGGSSPTGLATWRLIGYNISGTSGSKAVTGVPAVGELIVIVSFNTNSAYNAPTDNQGGTYTAVSASVGFNGGTATNRTNRLHVANQLVTAAVSTTFTATTIATSQGGIAVFAVTGMTKVGDAAIRQIKTAFDNNTAPSTPTATFTSAPLSGNTVLAALGTMLNPASMTPPTGFTEGLDFGWTTGPTGCEVAYDNNYTGGSTVTYGSSGTGAGWGLMIIEFDTSP